jgi:hypothetical protein
LNGIKENKVEKENLKIIFRDRQNLTEKIVHDEGLVGHGLI